MDQRRTDRYYKMRFPVTQVFNFFQNPDAVLHYAQGLEYFNNNEKYPGVRSKPLHEINPGLFTNLTNKVLNLWFHNNVSEFNCRWTFQKIKKGDVDERDGWPHTDKESAFTTIIYLTKNKEDFGTSILLPKNIGYNDEFSDLSNGINGPSMKMHGYNQSDIDKKYKEVNNRFKVVSQFKSIYNSAIMFDGNYPHQANFGALSDNEERITLIGFMYSVSATNFPIPQMNSVII